MIFISYRRADAGGHAGRLFDQLRLWFEADQLFYDQHTLDIGAKFPTDIANAVAHACVMLVVIGPDWLPTINQRVGAAEIDFVRAEIAGALARDIAIVPVLVGGASMPERSQLHAELHADIGKLCDRDALPLGGKQATWDSEFVRLREHLAQLAGHPARFRPPPGHASPWRIGGHQLSEHFQDPNGLLARLHQQLSSNGSATLIASIARAALHGLGGLGKTQLALKYSLDYRDHYPGGVWWFSAETDTGLQLDALAACTEVGAPILQGQTPAASLRHWLEQQSLPWLLVYDNAEKAESLGPWLPRGGPHRILITSRNPVWNGIAKTIELEVWTPDQSLAFLAPRLPGNAADELHALADKLGGLPLALEQAAGYIESTGCTVAAYRKLLADVKTEGLVLDQGRIATGYERNVLATLSLAFDKLSPAAAQVLRLLAYAAPEAFAERILREAADELPAELACAAAHELEWNALIAELRAYGLASRSTLPAWEEGAAEEPALSLHRLTQQALRARLADTAQDLSALQLVLGAACPLDAELPANWQRYATLLPHVTQLDRYRDADGLNRLRHAWLLDRVAGYLRCGPALYAESVHWSRRALDINQADLGGEHPDTLTTINNLAGTLYAQGDLSGALELEKLALAARLRTLGTEHPDTLTAMSNFANTLRTQGDLFGALELQKSALAVRRRVLGEEHPDTLTSMNNLAGILQAQGDLAGALELQKSVLAIRRRVLGEDHPDTLTAMNNLAGTLHAQGDLAGALEFQKSVLAMRQRVLGEEHPATFTVMGNLANTLLAQGELSAALELQKSALAGQRRALGHEHPSTITAMNNLASTLWTLGDLLGALELEKSALAIGRRVLGEEHPHTLTAMNNLASTLKVQGDLAGALELQKSALAIRQRILGDEHPDTLVSMNNIANTLHAQGDLSSALELQKAALTMGRSVLGEEHPATLTSMNNLAGILVDQSDLIGARQLQKSVLAVRRRVLGEEHPDTLTAMGNLAGTLCSEGDLVGALELEKSALAIRRRVFGEEHPATIISAWSLFVTLQQLGEKSAAQSLLDTHLIPLLAADPATLSADLNNIRQQLQSLFPDPPPAQ